MPKTIPTSLNWQKEYFSLKMAMMKISASFPHGMDVPVYFYVNNAYLKFGLLLENHISGNHTVKILK